MHIDEIPGNLYGWIAVLHIVSGSFFAANLVVMQVVTSGLMKRVPGGPLKRELDDFLESHWRPWIGGVIVILTATVLLMFLIHRAMILGSVGYLAKASLGGAALCAVWLNHFWLRHVKRKMARGGEKGKALDRIKKISHALERMALAGAAGAALMAIFLRHGP